jgi:VWFA-related protein
VIESPPAELVPIEASVVDQHGDFVGGLARDRFKVFDNGVEQPITWFAPIDRPAQVLVMLETSPAVYLIRDQHLAAARALLEGLGPEDQVALVTYDQAPKAALAFTADKSALLAALDKTQYTLGMGDLALYDSISAVLDWLRPMTGKRELVLLTTGLDSSPPSRWEALVKKLESEDVVIFSVELGGSLRARSDKKHETALSPGRGQERASKSEDAFERADQGLRSLARITGGLACFPHSDRDFAPLYREIAAALRHQYVLSISPAHDNQFHTLTVEANSSGTQAGPARRLRADYRVLARAGYLAPGP